MLLSDRFKWSNGGKNNPKTGHLDFHRNCPSIDASGNEADDDDDDDDDDYGTSNSNSNSNSSDVTTTTDFSGNSSSGNGADKKKTLEDKIASMRRDEYFHYLSKCFAGKNGYPFWCSFEGATFILFAILIAVFISVFLFRKFYYHSNHHRYVIIK